MQPVHVFVNNVLLEHSHAHSLTQCLWLLSHKGGATTETVWSTTLKTFIICPFTEQASRPLEHTSSPLSVRNLNVFRGPPASQLMPRQYWLEI